LSSLWRGSCFGNGVAVWLDGEGRHAAATETALTLNAANGRFSFTTPGTDGTASCADSTCSFGVSGGFAGANADTIGIAYQANRPAICRPGRPQDAEGRPALSGG
jgi:hypothetical protein